MFQTWPPFCYVGGEHTTIRMNKKLHVYAVLRVDDDIAGDQGITVKEILPTLEEAIQEVERTQST